MPAAQILASLAPALERAEFGSWDTLDVRVPIELSDDWVPLRVAARFQRGARLSVVPRLTVQSADCDARPLTLPLLARYTNEALPTEITSTHLTSSLPFLVHFFTVGLLLPATVKRVYTSRSATGAEQRQAAPAAFAIADRLAAPCEEGLCEEVLLLPRRERPSGELTASLLVQQGDPVTDREAPIAQLQAPFTPGGALRRFAVHPLAAPPAPGCPQPARASTPSGSFPSPWPRALPQLTAPAQAATPAESLAAEPAWAPHGAYVPGFAAEDLRTLWREAPVAVATGEAWRGVTARCEVRGVSGTGESVRLRLGSTPVWSDGGPRLMLVPLVHLAPGDPVSVEVERYTPPLFTIFGFRVGSPHTERLLSLRGRFSGGPQLALRDRPGELLCEPIARAVTEALAAPRLGELGEWLAEQTLGLPRFDVGAEDWGLGSSVVAAARARLSRIAALVGWSDPRLVPYRKRIDAMARDFSRDRARYLRSLQARQVLVLADGQPADPAASAALGLRTETLRCDAAGRCSLTLAVQNAGSAPCELARRCGLERPRLLFEDGGRAAADPVPRGARSEVLASGSTGSLRLTFPAHQGARPPLLLVVLHSGRELFLPLPSVPTR